MIFPSAGAGTSCYAAALQLMSSRRGRNPFLARSSRVLAETEEAFHSEAIATRMMETVNGRASERTNENGEGLELEREQEHKEDEGKWQGCFSKPTLPPFIAEGDKQFRLLNPRDMTPRSDGD